MKRYLNRIFSLLATCAIIVSLDAQSAMSQPGVPISLKNPSFEDEPRIGTSVHVGPSGWGDCGKLTETAPDIHPSQDSAFFDVITKATHGNTYVGMVVRDNGTWEAIGQRLRTPLVGGQCYNFSIKLARSPYYNSLSRNTNREVNYGKAAVLRFWGGNGNCSRMELLDETEEVENYEWRNYNLRLEPSRNYLYVMLEVFYKTPVMFEYNGNMLLDDASEIIPIPCDEEPEPPVEDIKEDLAINTPVPTPPIKVNQPKPNVPDATVDNSGQVSTTKPEKKKKEYVKELDEEIVIGQEITLKRLYFDADSATLDQRYFPIIDDIYDYLKENKKVVIEIGGHTNNRCEDDFCNSLSEARAQSVADYLKTKGIASHRVKYKGYGKTIQKYPNNTPTNRRRNQRVEIKILSLNG